MSSAYFKNGSLIESFTSTATSGGTLTLNSTSDAYQVLTGSTTHTIVLPNATTMVVNQRFEVINTSTGIITVNDSASTLIGTVAAGSTRIFRVTDISSSAGVWDATSAASGDSGGLSAAEATQFQALAATGFSAQSRVLKINPEEVGGNYFLTVAPLLVANADMGKFSLNGLLYGFGGYDGNVTQRNTTYRYNDDNNYWLQRSNYGQSFAQISGFSDGSFGYGSGGYNGSVGSVLSYKYTDSTDVWASIASLNGLRYNHSGWYLNGLGYAAGGFNGGSTLGSTEAYSSSANAWYTRLTTFPDSATGSANAAVLNNFAYMVNGDAASATPNNFVRKYNDATNSYQQVGTTLTARRYPSISSIAGTISIFGGSNSTTSYSSSEQYRDSTNTWVSIASFSTTARSELNNGEASLNDMGYVVGGDIASSSIVQSVVDRYVPTSMFSLGSLKQSNVVPTAISVAVILNSLSPNVPVQVQTDGSHWKNFMSAGSALKLNETLSTKFQPSSSMHFGGGVTPTRVQTHERYSEAQNTWTVRSSLGTSTTSDFGKFTIGGIGYLAMGTSFAGSLTNAGQKYVESTDTWSAIANSPQTKSVPASFVLDGYGYTAAGDTVASYPGETTSERYDPTANTWLSRAACTAADTLSGGFGIGAYGYFVTSFNGISYTANSTQKYDPVANAWSAGPTHSGVTLTTAAEMGGAGYIVGGYNGAVAQTKIDKFDQATGTISTIGNLGAGLYGHFGLEPYGGYLYTAGGNDPSNLRTASVQQVNIDSGTTVTKASISSVRTGGASHGANTSRDYKVRVGIPAFYAGVGGFAWLTLPNVPVNHYVGLHATLSGLDYMASGGVSQTTETDIFNKVINAWYIGPVQTGGFSYGPHFTLNNFLYTAGGYINGSLGTGTVRLNTGLNVWETVSATVNNGPKYRTSISGTSLNGLGYTIGGTDAGAGTQYGTEQFNPSANTWTNKASRPSVFYGEYDPVTRVNGFLMVVGGNNNFSSNVYTNAVEMYNDAANTWATKNTFPISCDNCGITGLSETGTVIVAGGRNNGSYTTNSYKYDAAADTWAVIQSIPTAATTNLTSGGIAHSTYNGSALINAYKLVPSVKSATLSAGLTVS